MSLNKYEFCKESLSELMKFVESAQSISHLNILSVVWEKHLPKNEKLLNEMLLFKTTEISKCIDLTENDDLNQVPHDVAIEDHVQKVSYTTPVSDLIVLIEENLVLSDEVITKLGNECLAESVQNVFDACCKGLDTESICKLGNSIVSANSTHRNIVALYFCQFVLIPKLFRESNKELTSLFITYLNNFPTTVSKTFSKCLKGYHCCLIDLQSNLYNVPNNQKQMLLRDLIMNITNLEDINIVIIDCLLTSGLSIETYQRLIELLYAASSCFSNDKLFGKMLLNFISTNSTNARHFEEQLRHIADMHRSVWKGKIQRTLDACMLVNNDTLSQTLHY